MSRLYREDVSSSSESESSSGSEESFDFMQEEQSFIIQKKPKYGKLFGDESSDSDDDRRRVVKSHKEKTYDDIIQCIKDIYDAYEDNEWMIIQSEFDKLCKVQSKAAPSLGADAVPLFFIKCLYDLDIFIQTTTANLKDSDLTFDSLNAKSFNAMKQKLKKVFRLFETEITNYAKNPVPVSLEYERRKEILSDSEFGDSSSESSDSSFEYDPKVKGIQQWLKKDTGAAKTGDDKQEKKPAKKVRIKEKKIESSKADDENDEYADADFFDTEVISRKFSDINSLNLIEKLKEIISVRGKKRTDRMEQIKLLEKLLSVASTPVHKVRVLLALISSQFDFNPSVSSSMNVDRWKAAELRLNELLSILESNEEIVIGEDVEEWDDIEDINDKAAKANNVRGSLISFIHRIDDEFTKSLQTIDPNTTEYIDRFRDESPLYALLIRSQKYFESKGNVDAICQIVLRRVEHIHYKPENIIKYMEENAGKYGSKSPATELIQGLCNYLNANSNNLKLKFRSSLCLIYFHAAQGRFYKARDMLMDGRMQDSVNTMDVATQILYNRTIVQLGLAAFRNGLIKEAHQALLELCSSGKQRELLAQGYSGAKQMDKMQDQDKTERLKQLPYHMHINLELIDCVYLTCSMLLEVPNIASDCIEGRSKVISKTLRRYLENHEKALFSGPPENTRELIIAATKALIGGDWKKCNEWIQSIKQWNLIPNVAEIKGMLQSKIKQEGLRSWLLGNGLNYETLSLSTVSQIFELDDESVYSIVCKMIYNEEMNASIDQPSKLLKFHCAQPNRVDYLSNICIEKLDLLAEECDKMVDLKHGKLEVRSRINTSRSVDYQRRYQPIR